jgi:hypothetical protein
VGYRRKEEVYPKAMYVDKSEQNYVDEMQLVGFPSVPVKTEGESVRYVGTQEGRRKRYFWTSYAMGFIVSKELKDDHMYGVIQKLSRALGDSARHTLETVSANLYNRAFNSSYVGSDGVSLCNSAHTSADTGVSQSNVPAVDADISGDMLETAFVDIAGFTDDAGIKVQLAPVKILIPRNLWVTVMQLMQSRDNPETMNRMTNVWYEKLTPIVWDYLSDSDAFFFLTDLPDDEGIKHFWRTRWEIAEGPDFDTMGTKYRLFGRFGNGWTDWRKVYGCQGG